MSESKLRELSMDFSVDIIELVKHLKSMKESIISNQIGRSGTSIGANIHEAQYAQGTKDFIFCKGSNSYAKLPKTSFFN